MRELLEKFYPREPIQITVSKLKLFLLFTTVCIIGGIIYIRSQNKHELELLKQKHQEIQLAVQTYFSKMSRVNDDEMLLNEYSNKLEKYKKQLDEIEDKIEDIKSFWFIK